jgi:DNA-binding response OmpR family regulator
MSEIQNRRTARADDDVMTSEAGWEPDTPSALTILLVDDQRIVGAALARLLAGEPVALQCCLDPAGALPMARTAAPDLILQDLVMPGVDGLDLVRAFRDDAATAGVPIVVLSAEGSPAARARALEAGASDYLVKLPAKEALLACIARHTRREPPAMAEAPRTVANADAPAASVSLAFPFRDGSPAARSFATQLIDQFVEEASGRVRTLDDAAARGDLAAVGRAAHSLRGAAQTIGAHRLGKLCAEIEDQLRRHEHVGVSVARLAAVREELIHVQSACRLEREALQS